jgi:iron complex outermembrane recepter protein
MESLMKHNRNPLAKAINYALGAGMIASLAMTAAPVAAQDDEEAADLDRVQVTGSRIKRTDVEGALPITVIDRESIELSGESNAADLIRSIPFNTSGSYRPQSGSSFGGVAEVSLRGLGAARTLVLVNGRRMPKAPLTGASSDLSMIPMGAIERIEILSDGASAVYGSDAIGGVVNVVLRYRFRRRRDHDWPR